MTLFYNELVWPAAEVFRLPRSAHVCGRYPVLQSRKPIAVGQQSAQFSPFADLSAAISDLLSSKSVRDRPAKEALASLPRQRGFLRPAAPDPARRAITGHLGWIQDWPFVETVRHGRPPLFAAFMFDWAGLCQSRSTHSVARGRCPHFSKSSGLASGCHIWKTILAFDPKRRHGNIQPVSCGSDSTASLMRWTSWNPAGLRGKELRSTSEAGREPAFFLCARFS